MTDPTSLELILAKKPRVAAFATREQRLAELRYQRSLDQYVAALPTESRNTLRKRYAQRLHRQYLAGAGYTILAAVFLVLGYDRPLNPSHALELTAGVTAGILSLRSFFGSDGLAYRLLSEGTNRRATDPSCLTIRD